MKDIKAILENEILTYIIPRNWVFVLGEKYDETNQRKVEYVRQWSIEDVYHYVDWVNRMKIMYCARDEDFATAIDYIKNLTNEAIEECLMNA